MTRRGFTLVEVLVALVVLEVGLLGVVGTLVLAARTLARAELRDVGTAEVERVLDSLLASGSGSGQGSVSTPAGEVVWSASDGRIRLMFHAPLDSALVVVEGLTPPIR